MDSGQDTANCFTVPGIVPPPRRCNKLTLTGSLVAQKGKETKSKHVSLVANGDGKVITSLIYSIGSRIFLSLCREVALNNTQQHPPCPPSHTQAAAAPERIYFSRCPDLTPPVVHAAHAVCHLVNCCFATYRPAPPRPPPCGQQTTKVIPTLRAPSRQAASCCSCGRAIRCS